MEESKHIVVEKYQFENLDVYINNIAFLTVHQSVPRKKHTHYGLNAKLAPGSSQKTAKPCHHFLKETSVLRGFDKYLSL